MNAPFADTPRGPPRRPARSRRSVAASKFAEAVEIEVEAVAGSVSPSPIAPLGYIDARTTTVTESPSGLANSRPAMRPCVSVRSIRESDYEGWLPLWEGYNAFYGQEGATALDPEITKTTWRRFFDPGEPVFALVAQVEGRLAGLAHYLYHRSTTRIELTCYLQDLFTAREARGQGVGRALIEAVYRAAASSGIKRVYWQTHETNSAGRVLYDKVAKHLGFIVYSHDV